MMTSQVVANPLGWNTYNKREKIPGGLKSAKMLPNMQAIPGSKRQRVSTSGEYKDWNMFTEQGDENKNVCANLPKPMQAYAFPMKRPQAAIMLDGIEYNSIKQAALSLLNLSVASSFNEPYPWKGSGKSKTLKSVVATSEKLEAKTHSEKSEKKKADKTKHDEKDDNNPLDSELYRRRAQELLFQHSDILLGERKDAFFELVKRLCPYINIVRSGSRTLRTYLVDTRKKKRYRTYSDAIKGGALDPLLVETGTTVLLRGCVEEAKKRFTLLPKKDQMYIHTLKVE